MNENIKDKEINNKNMNMQEFLDKCKTGNIDEKNIPVEILSVFEMLYAKRKEQEQAETKQNKSAKENTALNMQSGTPAVSYIDGLSLEDIKYINEQAVSSVEKYTKEKFNMENVAHREYFEYFKQQALKEKEQEIKMKQFEKSLHEKYGPMYEQVEIAARNAFENMAYRDAKNIIMSRMKGDIETLITFYDNIYKGLQSEKKMKENVNENMVFPPKAIKGGNYANASQKQAGYENFI